VGGLLGSLSAGRLSRRLGDARAPVLMTLVMVPAGLLLPLTGTGRGLGWLVVGSVILSGSIGVFNVCVISATQATTPSAMLGRVVVRPGCSPAVRCRSAPCSAGYPPACSSPAGRWPP
jgi:predicted MFS family arabinose efflux permease